MKMDKIYTSVPSMKVAFIGLGTMGYPMAGHLKLAGHDVCVYNRTTEKAQRWVDTFGGRMAVTPAEAAEGASIVFACVGNDDDLRSVVLGDHGAFSGMAKGTLFVDHTTASATVARELYAKGLAQGVQFVDAPVSGGQSGAENGCLTVMCGGEEEAFERAKPVMTAYANATTYFGVSGAGQLAKMVNQICIAGCVQGLAEAVAFGKNAGLDMPKVIDALSAGAASSWQMINRGKTMDQGKFDFGFAVDWMRKDLGIVKDEAKRNGSDISVTTLVDEYYAEIQNVGGGRLDTSSLIIGLPR